MSTRVPDPKHYVTGGMTDVGQVRKVNQDYCDELFDEATGRRMLVLADGMGGHRGGEVASQLAVESVAQSFAKGGSDANAFLRASLEAANADVHRAALESPNLAGMGTTCVCLLFEAGGSAWVGHVGDSRAYHLRDGKLTQITEDHSVVGALVRMGHITEEEARRHPQRNEVLRAIGTYPEVEVDIAEVPLDVGDRYLLCSDGLSGMVTDDEIARVLGDEEPESAVRTLVGMANLEGGTDNITVQIAAIPADSHAPAEATAGRTEQLATLTASSDGARSRTWLWAAGAALLVALGWLFLRRG